MNCVITPSKLKGKIAVPPSKSIAHRALICAGLACGESVIEGIASSDDILATINGLVAFGAEIKVDNNKAFVKGIGEKYKTENRNSKVNDEIVIDCIESGSTLRFLLPIALALGIKTRFVGHGKLGLRPMSIYEKICKNLDIFYSNNNAGKAVSLLDITVDGKLTGGEFEIAGDVSSQFASGLLLAGGICEDTLTVKFSSAIQSEDYIKLTVDTMSDFGANTCKKEGKYSVASRSYKPNNYIVEGDYSQGAFFVVANYLGGEIEIKGLNCDSAQGDKAILDFVAKLERSDEQTELVFDGSGCPDIVPILCVACALRQGKTRIVNVARLRLKECDRLVATAEELTKLGANIKVVGDSFEIEGVNNFVGAVTDSHNDHRIAMMIAIASERAIGNVEIKNCECVRKSYPNFFEDFISLGGVVK